MIIIFDFLDTVGFDGSSLLKQIFHCFLQSFAFIQYLEGGDSNSYPQGHCTTEVRVPSYLQQIDFLEENFDIERILEFKWLEAVILWKQFGSWQGCVLWEAFGRDIWGNQAKSFSPSDYHRISSITQGSLCAHIREF